MSRAYVEENAQQRERLRLLVSRLGDQELTRPLSEGWTVSAILGHLAFWDYRGDLLLKKWKQSGTVAPVVDVDVINDSMLPILRAIPPRRAGEMAEEAAAAIDKEIEGLSPELLARIEANPPGIRLDRAHHRRTHLDQIESILSLGK